jgi:hypothetical protein
VMYFTCDVGTSAKWMSHTEPSEDTNPLVYTTSSGDVQGGWLERVPRLRPGHAAVYRGDPIHRRP